MSGITKLGFFLLGVGVGAFGATFIMKRELEKPIGEFEEYIPLEDREGFEDFDDISEDGSRGEQHDNIRSQDVQNGEKDIRGRSVGRGWSRDKREGDDRQSGRHNDREERHTEFSSNQDDILNYYRSNNENATRPKAESRSNKNESEREKFERERRGHEQSTKYSRMYKEEAIQEALRTENSHRNSRNSYEVVNDGAYSDSYVDDYNEYEDSPSDDDFAVVPVFDEDLHEKYNLERVEKNIEVFLDDNPQDFITMIFYEGDNTLCDDGEKVVPNAEEVIGLAALSRLIEGGPGAENGVIFVHNLKTSLNYEVVLDAGAYRDTVIGQFESHLYGDGGIGGNT